jgi:hypothetical protein
MKKTIIISVIVLVLALAAYFIFRKPKEEEPAAGTDPATGSGGTGSETPDKVIKSNPMPLKMGSGHIVGSEENTLVKDVQTALNTKHGAKLVVDGKFGAKTLAALIASGYGGVIYWKQYSKITGKALTTDQQASEDITGIFTADNAANWWSYLTNW